MERKITIEEKSVYEEDYQMAMLKANSPEHLLPVSSRWIDESSYFDYDVTGKVSLQAVYEKIGMSGEELLCFLEYLILARKEVEKFLLKDDCLLLSPEYIFCEEDQYYFCYYPLSKDTFWNSFHRLTEYLVKKVDYQDPRGVQMVFFLHQGVMQENYSLENLVKGCRKLFEEAGNAPEKEKETAGVYQDANPWVTDSASRSMIRETNDMWTPMRKFLNKYKKTKWGNWEGFHIEDLMI